jgi:hypothetical protein
MAVKALVVELLGDGSRGVVTIESDLPDFVMQIEELQSAKARDFVLQATIKAGIKGLPGISRTVDSPYPVTAEGESLETLKDEKGVPIPLTDPRATPKSYRAKYEVTARQ